jgi:hypothetical protein
MEVARESFTADGAEDRRWQGLVMASSVAGMVQHASAEFVSAGESFAAGTAMPAAMDAAHSCPARAAETRTVSLCAVSCLLSWSPPCLVPALLRLACGSLAAVLQFCRWLGITIREGGRQRSATTWCQRR